MPKVEITDSKGLVQKTGSGFESQKHPKSVLTLGSSVSLWTFAAANGAGADYTGGKFFVLNGKTKKYQLHFSSVAGAAQDTPTKLDGHQLVAIGNFAADATATQVGAAVAAAVGAGPGNGIAELTALNNSGAVTIASVSAQKAAADDTIGNMSSSEITALSILDSGAGDDTAGVALRPGAVNIIKSPDFGASHTAVNNDGTESGDNAKFTLGDGDYQGQETTIVRAVPASTNALGIQIVVLSHLRHLDGGDVVDNEELTLQAHDQADGCPIFKCIWDGTAWMSLMGVAEAQMGWSGTTSGA